MNYSVVVSHYSPITLMQLLRSPFTPHDDKTRVDPSCLWPWAVGGEFLYVIISSFTWDLTHRLQPRLHAACR